MSTKKDKNTIQESLKELEQIVAWFEKDSEFDVEIGLQRVKEGVELARELKTRLQDIENEFKEIKLELKDEK